jgi:hypothetical protein
MNPRWILLGALVACTGKGEGTSEDPGPKTYRPGGDADWPVPLEDCWPTTFYEDLDGDGYGVDGTAVDGETCRPPDRHATRGGDCDDRASSVNPAATEICDGRDNDCDDLVDDEDAVAGGREWFRDDDGDGYGDESELVEERACEGPEGTAVLVGDCDDSDPLAHPGRAEDLEDGVDNDCDGLTDLRGKLTGTWTIAKGESAVPGERTCMVPWAIEGFWDPSSCPDCMLSFDSTAVNDTGAVETGCEWVLDSEAFWLHALQSGMDTYLAVSVEYEGYGYYGYYGYYGSGGYTAFFPVPDVPMSWDGRNLRFAWGDVDTPVETAEGVVYYTYYWRFEGIVE